MGQCPSAPVQGLPEKFGIHMYEGFGQKKKHPFTPVPEMKGPSCNGLKITNIESGAKVIVPGTGMRIRITLQDPHGKAKSRPHILIGLAQRANPSHIIKLALSKKVRPFKGTYKFEQYVRIPKNIYDGCKNRNDCSYHLFATIQNCKASALNSEKVSGPMKVIKRRI